MPNALPRHGTSTRWSAWPGPFITSCSRSRRSLSLWIVRRGAAYWVDGRQAILIVLLCLVAVVSTIVTVGIGAVSIPASTVIAIIRDAISPAGNATLWTIGQQHIILDLR